MSWAEVKIINDNFKVPLNTQIEKIGIVRSWLFETTTTWTPPYSGKYRIFCIGAGETVNIGMAAALAAPEC